MKRVAAGRLLYRGPSVPDLQRDYAKQHRIDVNAQLVSSSTLEIDAPIESVWRALADVVAWPRWAPRVEVVSVTSVLPDAPFSWRLNGVKIAARFAVVSPPTELAWTGSFLGYHAVDRNLLEPMAARRTRATFEESLAGLLLSLFYRSSQLRANHERWLGSLKTFVESSLG